MADEKKEAAGTSTDEKGSCAAKRCCGSKAVIGGLLGLILAGAGFGLYHAGKCAGRMCPIQQQAQPAK